MIHGEPWGSLPLNQTHRNAHHPLQSQRMCLDLASPALTCLTLFNALYRCNTSPSNASSFFGITYDNMVHVSDMRVLLTPDANHSDFKTVGFYSPVSQQPFYAGLGLFGLALDEWLPCFVGA